MSRRVALGSALWFGASIAVGRAEEPQQRILVFGDSQAQGLAGGVQRHYRGDREHRVLDRSKISTGLVPRANYDWPAQAKGIAGGEKASIAIALFGANDRPPVRVGGAMEAGLVQRFIDTYGARVSEIAGAFKQNNIPLVWVGHPIVRDAVFAEDMELLNQIFADRAPEAGADYLSTWEEFRGPDGNFNAYGKGLDGQTTKLRADDGVHMTPAGYDVITGMLLPYIDRARGLGVSPPAAGRDPVRG